MNRCKKLYPLTLGAMLLTGSHIASAQQQIEQGFYIAPSLGYYFYDGDNDDNAKDAPFYGLTLGLQFNKNLALEASYFRIESEIDPKHPGANPKNPKEQGLFTDERVWLPYTSGGDLSVDAYRVGAVFSLGTSTGASPYVGVGYTKLDPDPELGDPDDMMDVGLGVKYAITPNLFVRGDVRALHSWDNEDTDYSAGLSVGYLFGKSTGPGQPEQKAEGDADGDGVVDSADACPDTPAGTSVDSKGCPIGADGDGDGVPDSRDSCPDTPAGSQVDERGCPVSLPGGQEEVSIELEVLFDTNKAAVKQEYYDSIKRVAEFMRQYPYTTAVIEGHTDSKGSAKLNKRLSQRRADAVREVLIRQFSVEASRLTAVGYGKEHPIADNSSEAGRRKNRRVVAVVKANDSKGK